MVTSSVRELLVAGTWTGRTNPTRQAVIAELSRHLFAPNPIEARPLCRGQNVAPGRRVCGPLFNRRSGRPVFACEHIRKLHRVEKLWARVAPAQGDAVRAARVDVENRDCHWSRRIVNGELWAHGRRRILPGVESFRRRKRRFVAEEEPSEVARGAVEPSLDVSHQLRRRTPRVGTDAPDRGRTLRSALSHPAARERPAALS